MKTQVQMRRELFGGEVLQKSKSEFFSATHLANVGNKWRRDHDMAPFQLSQFLKSKSTGEFIAELEAKYGTVIESGRGRNSVTWVHPLLFIDIALAISPKLKIEVYEWLFDHLIKNRNDSGDSYKRMTAALYGRYENKRDFPRFISKAAEFIRESCAVDDWQSASEDQLRLRDLIHISVSTLCNVLSDPSQAVRLGVKEHIKFCTIKEVPRFLN